MDSGTFLFCLFIIFFAHIVCSSASEYPLKLVLWLPVSLWHDLINLWALGCFLAQQDIPGSPCTFSAPALETAKTGILFRSQDLDSRCAHSYWDVTAPRQSWGMYITLCSLEYTDTLLTLWYHIPGYHSSAFWRIPPYPGQLVIPQARPPSLRKSSLSLGLWPPLWAFMTSCPPSPPWTPTSLLHLVTLALNCLG